MTLVFFALIILIISSASCNKEEVEGGNYLSIRQTTNINGIYVLLVFMSHLCQHVTLDKQTDFLYLDARAFMNQLIVVSFLFFSGYGIMVSIMKKGSPYINGMFKNRFLKLLLHFDIAVMIYYVFNLASGKRTAIKDLLIALTSWEGIGNSSWFITATLVLYIIVIVSFFIFRKLPPVALTIASALTVVYVYYSMKYGRNAFTYNTMITFMLGMWFAYLKKYFDKIFAKSNIFWALGFAAMLFAFAFAYTDRFKAIEVYSVWVCAFAMILVFISMKIQIKSKVLEFFGKHVFSIYILQRIPFTIFQKLGLDSVTFVYFSLSLVTTIFIALLFDYCMDKIDSVLFKPRKKLKKAENE